MRQRFSDLLLSDWLWRALALVTFVVIMYFVARLARWSYGHVGLWTVPLFLGPAFIYGYFIDRRDRINGLPEPPEK